MAFNAPPVTDYTGKKDQYNFPATDIPNAEKDEAWFLSMVKNIWTYSYGNCGTMFFFNLYENYRISSYCQGRQPINDYMVQMGINPSDTTSHININWTPFPALVTFYTDLINKVNKVGYKIEVFPLDPFSSTQKAQWYANKKAKLIIKDFLDKQDPSLSQYLTPTDNSFDDPATQEELDLISRFSYKDINATKMKKVVDMIFDENNIKQQINQWDADKVKYEVMVGKTDIDSNGNVTLRRVDPRFFITSYSVKPDFIDSFFYGEVLFKSIETLRQEAQDAFTDRQYDQIQRLATSMNGFTLYANFTTQNLFYDYHNLIPVVDIEFQSLWYLNENNEKYKRRQIAVWMKAKWIVGTNFIYDYGLKNNMIREKNSLQNARSSFRVIAPLMENMSVTSRIQRCIPIEDNLCILWYKFLNELNHSVPRGWAFDESAMENLITMDGKGGGINTKTEMAKTFLQSGSLHYRSDLMPGDKRGDIPIKELANGLSPQVIQYFNLLSSGIRSLRTQLGLSDLATGEGTAERTNEKGLKMMFEASDVVLQDIIDCRKKMLEFMAKDVILRTQDVLKVKKIEGYVNTLGKNTVEFITEGKSLSRNLFGTKIADAPDTDKKMVLEQTIADAFSKQELDAADIFLIESMDDLSQAYMYLAYKHKIYQKRLPELQKKQGEIENQLFTQKQMAEANAKIAVIKAETEAKITEDNNNSQWQMKLDEMKYSYELKIAAMKADASLDGKKIEASARIQTKMTETPHSEKKENI